MATTVPQAVIEAAQRYGAAEAVVDGDMRLSFADLHARVRDFARFLIARGVQPGDRVALWSPNTHHWIVAALGLQYAGASLVPINTRYTAHEALDLLVRTRAVALVVVGPFLGTDRFLQLQEAAGPDGLPDLATVVTVEVDGPSAGTGVLRWDELGQLAATVSPGLADERAAAVADDDVADILFTSGTTGRSKGVLSAHRQVIGVARAWAECGEVVDDDTYLIVSPFFHSFGYKAGIIVCLLAGATIVPMAVYDVLATMTLVAAERISILTGAPTIFSTILDHPERADLDLTSLRLAVTGASVVPVALVERMQTELGFDIVLTAFGQTEAVVATMCRRSDPPELVAHTCGRAVADFEARIGEQGELLLRGPNVMLGYLDDPDSTAAAIDADGWLHTGDVATLDDNGYLTITDRLKDMYICGGFNVYPAEVEQALVRLDGVSEVAVVGVPDQRLGEVGLAVVVPAPSAQLDAETVIAYSRTRLANFKVPRHVVFAAALPRNASGKVLKNVLREESSNV